MNFLEVWINQAISHDKIGREEKVMLNGIKNLIRLHNVKKKIEEQKQIQKELLKKKEDLEELKTIADKAWEQRYNVDYIYKGIPEKYRDTFFYTGRNYISARAKRTLDPVRMITYSFANHLAVLAEKYKELDIVKVMELPEEERERIMSEAAGETNHENPRFHWKESFVLYCEKVETEEEGLTFTFSDPYDTIKTLPTREIPLKIAANMPNCFVHITMKFLTLTQEFILEEVHEILDVPYRSSLQKGEGNC